MTTSKLFLVCLCISPLTVAMQPACDQVRVANAQAIALTNIAFTAQAAQEVEANMQGYSTEQINSINAKAIIETSNAMRIAMIQAKIASQKLAALIKIQSKL